MSRLKGAVIGAGYFSHFHFDAWNRIDEVELVACCDTDAAKAESVAGKYEVPKVYTDYRSMLDEHDLDFVDIITRPDTHLKMVQEIAGRSIAMICQKPLAPNVDEVRQVIQAADSAGVRFMVHENFRFQPWCREIKTLFESGVIGDRLHTLTARNRMGDGWGDDAYLARQPYFQTMEKFLIFEAGIHTIDTFRFLGGEISQAWCVHRRLNPVIAGEDTALGVFQFESAGMGIYDASRFNESTSENPRYTFGELSLEANGGTIRLYDDARITIQPLGEAERDHVYTPSQHGFAGDCVYETQRHFVDGLLNETPFETDAESYAKSIAVQEAMYRSAQSGTWEKPSL
jgi:predicted dehydrogenase